MTLPVSRTLSGPKFQTLHIGMQTKQHQQELLISPPVNQCYKFPYFVKGVPPKWKNAPPSVRLFRPFDYMKFRLMLRMLDKRRRKPPKK